MHELIRVKIVFVVFALGVVFQLLFCADSHQTEQELYKELQKIPPLRVSALKFMKYFLDQEPGKGRHKRQSLLPQTQYDVTFVFDSSSSVSDFQFNKGKSALTMLVERARPNTKYAAVTISTRSRLVFNFSELFIAREKLQQLNRTGGKTNTQEALQICYKLYINPSSGVRTDSFKRILVVTDGQSNIKPNLTVENAFRLKQLGVQIFVVAVGEYLDGLQELVGMASTTFAHMYRVADLEGFSRLVKLIPPANNQVGPDGPLGVLGPGAVP